MFTASVWIALFIAFVVGALLGFAFSAWRNRETESSRREVRRLKRELESYKGEVCNHFVRTADLVNEMTHAYKGVYDHLEKGAYRLVGEEALHKRLKKVEAEPVMLEYIGQRRGEPETAVLVEESAPSDEAVKGGAEETASSDAAQTRTEEMVLDDTRESSAQK